LDGGFMYLVDSIICARSQFEGVSLRKMGRMVANLQPMGTSHQTLEDQGNSGTDYFGNIFNSKK